MIALGQMISNVLALMLVFVLIKTSSASINYLACVYGVTLVIANVILSIWFYQQHPELRPKPNLGKQHINPLLSVGMQFLTIQLAVLVIFTTDKMLITQFFGPQYVTQYDVVFKLFSLITFTHTLISLPLWSAYTDAFHRNDLAWVKGMLNKQLKIFGGIVMLVFLVSLLAKPIISIWIGPDMEVSMSLVMAMGVFVIVSTWNNIYAMFVNGTSKIKPQLYTAIIAMIINIPLALIFVKYFTLGLSSIVLATSISLLFAAVVLPIQVHKMVFSKQGDA